MGSIGVKWVVWQGGWCEDGMKNEQRIWKGTDGEDR
jgi:hypothetical protein